MLTILKTLCETSAAPGNEGAIAKLIAEEVRPYVDEVYTDALGNLIAHKKGAGKKLMFAAHMDEIGLVATCYGEKGQVYVAALGGVTPQTALYQRVRFSGGAEGVLVPDGKLDDIGKNLSLQKMYVDMGAKNEEDAKAKVALGETGVFGGCFALQGDCVISKALDNRSGCAALIYGLQQAKRNVNDLYYVFTVSEELGLRGAKAAAVSIAPDYAVALDVTPTGDVSSTNKRAVSLGEGVAVKIMDRSFIAHPIIKDRMVELCEKHSLPHQLEVLEMGGTDAGAIHLTCGGVPSGCISIPVRYVHTPGEMISAKDLQNTGELAKLLIEEGIE